MEILIQTSKADGKLHHLEINDIPAPNTSSRVQNEKIVPTKKESKPAIMMKVDEIIKLKPLGRGSFATVYACTLQHMKGRFAVKEFILPSNPRDREITVKRYFWICFNSPVSGQN